MVAARTLALRKNQRGLQTENAERKRTVETLRESEERFSGASNMRHWRGPGFADATAQGQPPLCALVGYSEAELLARNFQDITHPGISKADLENVRRLFRGEIHPTRWRNAIPCPRTSHHGFVECLARARWPGPAAYFISQIQDITERKRLEAQLSSRKRWRPSESSRAGRPRVQQHPDGHHRQSELLREDLPATVTGCNAIEISKAASRAATLTGNCSLWRKQFLRPKFLT